MSEYTDLYIEFAAESSGRVDDGDTVLLPSDVKCVCGSYARSTRSKRREHYYSYEFESGIELNATVVAHITQSLRQLMQHSSTVLIVGLGNYHYSADALGKAVLDRVVKRDNVYKLYPQCVGVTGIESTALLKSAIKMVRPDVVIAIDSLATRNLSRLGRVVQITDGGITPGGGLNSTGTRLTNHELKCPIIAVGAPLIIKTASLTALPCTVNQLLTSAYIDEIIEEIADLIANSINDCLKTCSD